MSAFSQIRYELLCTMLEMDFPIYIEFPSIQGHLGSYIIFKKYSDTYTIHDNSKAILLMIQSGCKVWGNDDDIDVCNVWKSIS